MKPKSQKIPKEIKELKKLLDEIYKDAYHDGFKSASDYFKSHPEEIKATEKLANSHTSGSDTQSPQMTSASDKLGELRKKKRSGDTKPLSEKIMINILDNRGRLIKVLPFKDVREFIKQLKEDMWNSGIMPRQHPIGKEENSFVLIKHVEENINKRAGKELSK